MAIYQPSQIVPDVRSGIGLGVVNAAKGMTVSWHINGPSAMTSYSITIYTNNAASTQKYTTGTISTGCPAYGTTSDGEPQLFSYTIPAATLSSAGITNGNEYKLLITQNWSGGSVTQSSASVFVTRATPTLSIATIGSSGVISTRFYTFTGNYSQAQGDVLNYFRWRIAYDDDFDNVIFDSGNVTGTMDISCYYDGFFTDTNYAIRLTAQTENGVEADTGWVSFSCSYETQAATGQLNAVCASGTDAVLLNWTGATKIEGLGSGTYSVQDGKAILNYSSSISWPKTSSLGFPNPWGLIYSFHIDRATLAGTVPFISLQCASGLTITFSWKASQHMFTLDIDVSGTTTTVNIDPYATMSSGKDFVLVLTNNHYYITTKSGGVHILNLDGALSYSQKKLNNVTIYGVQECNYVEVTNGTVSPTAISDIQDWRYTPGTHGADYMLANWTSGIDAMKPLTESALTIDGFSIFRLNERTGAFTKIAAVDAFTGQLYDYGAKSQQGPYTYYAFPESGSSYQIRPFISQSISPCWWNWTLMECEDTDDKNIFTVVSAYRFRLNVQSGSISNNNQPSVLQNFTPYPKVQISPHNYRGGTLQGLIGVVDAASGQPRYVDTVEWEKALYAISVSQKPLFLKNRKGDLIKIRISSPISMTTADETREQMQTISLPWVEVGGADNASLYSTTYVGAQQLEG